MEVEEKAAVVGDTTRPPTGGGIAINAGAGSTDIAEEPAQSVQAAQQPAEKKNGDWRRIWRKTSRIWRNST